MRTPKRGSTKRTAGQEGTASAPHATDSSQSHAPAVQVHLTLRATGRGVLLTRGSNQLARFGPDEPIDDWRGLLEVRQAFKPTSETSRRALSILVLLASHPRRSGAELVVPVSELRALDAWQHYTEDGPLAQEARRLVAGEVIQFRVGSGGKGATPAKMVLRPDVRIDLGPLSAADGARQWMAAHDPWPKPGIVPESGVLSCELRDEVGYLEGHRKLIACARREVAICALSGNQTMNGLLRALTMHLEANGTVYLMIMRPGSPALPKLDRSQKRKVGPDITQTLGVLRERSLHRHTSFKVRFMDSLPPFMAIMKDGDIMSQGNPARTEGGEVRAQPVSLDHTLLDGVILHAAKRGDRFGWFEHISETLRRCWSDATEDPNLFGTP